MNHTLRDLNESDLPELAALISQVAVEPMSLSQLRDWHNRQPEGHIRRCRVAVDAARQIFAAPAAINFDWEQATCLFSSHSLKKMGC